MLADRYGRRKFVLIGLISAPSLALIGFTSIPYVQVLAAIASLAWTASWPSIIAPVVSEKAKSGYRYGTVTLGGSLGWGIGCSTTGFIYELGGVRLITLIAALTLTLSYIVFYIAYPKKYDIVGNHGIRSKTITVNNVPKSLLIFLLAVGIRYFGVSWAFNVLSIKLYVEVG